MLSLGIWVADLIEKKSRNWIGRQPKQCLNAEVDAQNYEGVSKIVLLEERLWLRSRIWGML